MDIVLTFVGVIMNTQEVDTDTLTYRTAEFISQWEGLRTEPYLDTKNWAICYGHRSYVGDKKTEEECWEMMMTSAEIMNKYVTEIYDVELTDNQIIALSSLHYNVSGPYHVTWRANHEYSDTSIANAIKMYTYAGGVELDWLIKRRNAEAELFLKK